MTLQLNNAQGNNVQLDYTDQAGGSDVAILFPQTSGTVRLDNTSGNIVQMVRASADVQVQILTDTYTDIGLSRTITPQYSDSILLIQAVIQFSFSRQNTNTGAGMRLLRGNTVVWQNMENATGPLAIYSGVSGAPLVAGYTMSPMMFVDDTHNSTAELTYHFEGRPYTSTNSGSVEFQTDSSGGPQDGQSFMTIMEVRP